MNAAAISRILDIARTFTACNQDPSPTAVSKQYRYETGRTPSHRDLEAALWKHFKETSR